MSMHSVVGAELAPRPSSPRVTLIRGFSAHRPPARVYAEAANLRPSIFCLRAVARLQKEDTTAD